MLALIQSEARVPRTPFRCATRRAAVMDVAADAEPGTEHALVAAQARPGAFALDPASKDAVLLTTLAPGLYTMRVADSGGQGVALVEIYEIPPSNRFGSISWHPL